MISLGIDPSSSGTGVVALNDKGEIILKESLEFRSKPNFEHLKKIYSYFYRLIKTFDVVALEGYSMNSKGKNLSSQIELGAMIRLAAHDNFVKPTYIIAPQSLKKFVAPKTFKKDEMRLAVYKRWGFEDKSNDIVDAYALAKYAQALYNDIHKIRQELKVFQNQTITAWKKNKIGLYVEK